MRCPKCGYISFDHLEICLKCKKDIRSTSEELQGTVYNVAAPAFLKFGTPDEAEGESNELDAFVAVDDDVEDSDLDILLEADDEGSADEVAFALDEDTELALDGEDEDSDLAFSDDLEHGEDQISLDADVFAEEEDLLSENEPEEPSFKMDLPEELSDMSDLEPPSQKEDAEPAFDDFSLDLDEGGDDASPAAASLSLDDEMDFSEIDFDAPAPSSDQKKAAADKMNIEEDLDFELDLGDLFKDEK